jgi:hypothetical protein
MLFFEGITECRVNIRPGILVLDSNSIEVISGNYVGSGICRMEMRRQGLDAIST